MPETISTTRLSTKGQIVLPLSIRNARAWNAGTQLTVEETAEGVLLRATRLFAETSLASVAGCLKTRRLVAAPLDNTDAAIAHEVKRRHDIGRY